jgi:hypothetical protein
MGKHHNIFGKDDEDRDVFHICNNQGCVICNYIIKEKNFKDWLKGVELVEWDFIYYQRFTFEVKNLGNEDLLDCINETITESFLKTNVSNKEFYLTNHFALFGFFHPHPNEFLSSSISVEIYSLTPFPENTIRDIGRKIRNYFFLCECDYTHGTFTIKDEMMLSQRQELMSKRSLLLLQSENYPPQLTDRLYSVIIAGLTPLSFGNGRIDNIILNNRIQVNSHQRTLELS